MASKDPFAMNIDGANDLVSSKTNKLNYGVSVQNEGVVSEKIDELELKMDDEELLLLAKKWEQRYMGYEAKLKLRQQANLQYYLGKQKESTPQMFEEGKGISANFLFEAVETFLPAALSRNPEPVVWSDNSPQGNKIADTVKTMLQYHADALVLRRKLEMMTRKWCVDMLGVLKHGWDSKTNDIKTEVRDAKNFIFDVNGYVDMYGNFTGYLGERITISAERLTEMFPKHTEFITVMVDGKMGTDVAYTEWWTDDYCFYSFKSKILDKHKNPHFNYDREEPGEFNQGTGEEGETKIIPGKNHFACPFKPYTFLSVFSMGDKPHDNTGLIEQNIPNQRLISRRIEQIDYNISRSNNSTVFSELGGWNQETAKQASQARLKGHPLLSPGNIDQGMKDFPPGALPTSFFSDLENNIENLRSIFGTAGITASNQDDDETARGMILKQQYDNSRIGGGIGDAEEQVAKNVFNWWVQMYYVYYDEPHFASVMGQLKATEYIELSSQNLNGRLIVSVSPDSMKPHDEVTNMNQALSLWEAGAIDPLTLLTRLNFPSPKETAGQFMMYKLAPQQYFAMNWPELAQQLAQAQQQKAMAQAQQGGQQVGAGQTPAPQPGTTGGVPASSSLSSVPLPK